MCDIKLTCLIVLMGSTGTHTQDTETSHAYLLGMCVAVMCPHPL